MAGLQHFAGNIWVADGDTVSVAGFRYGTRMAVIRLADGGLFVWSPVALPADLKGEVDALGTVRWLVTPTRLHNLFLPQWKRAYPDAVLFAAPGSRKRSPHIAFDGDLGEEPGGGWAGEIDQVLMHGNLIAVEAVFFHRESRTVLIADLIQNFEPGWFSGWRAIIARLDGLTAPEPEVPRKFRLAFVNRKVARSALARVLDWPAERVVMAHCPPVGRGGAAFIRRAFCWLV
jgi:hypothetical protein